GLILVNRSFDASPLRALLRPNRWLWLLLGGVAALLAFVVAWPPAQALFRFGQLHWQDIVPAAAAALASLTVLELVKHYWFRVAATDVGAYPANAAGAGGA